MYELRIMPCDYYEKHPEAWCAELGDDGVEVLMFKKLSDVWDHLGFKLKRERCGWCGIVDEKEYLVMRTA